MSLILATLVAAFPGLDTTCTVRATSARLCHPTPRWLTRRFCDTTIMKFKARPFSCFAAHELVMRGWHFAPFFVSSAESWVTKQNYHVLLCRLLVSGVRRDTKIS